MTKLHGKRPSPALVVSIVALVVAMAGTGYAQFTLPDKSVGTRQLKNGAVTNKKLHTDAVTDVKISKNTITGDRIKLGTLGTVPKANLANSATRANSAQPTAFAHVSHTGGLDTGNSKNVSSVTVNSGASSLYCISGIPFTPRGGQATVDGNDGGAQDGAQVDLGTTTGCPNGTQAMVYTYSSFSGGTPDGFFVVFYR
jgi:hypothetical protein